TPARTWYTPLLLIRHAPERLAVSVPCSLPRALPHATNPDMILATARSPIRLGGLAVTRSSDGFSLSLGHRLLARVALPGAGASCIYRIALGNGRWEVTVGPDGMNRGGALQTMPFVDGLFSGIDLRSGIPPKVALTTFVYGARPIERQTISWTVAALAALV